MSVTPSPAEIKFSIRIGSFEFYYLFLDRSSSGIGAPLPAVSSKTLLKHLKITNTENESVQNNKQLPVSVFFSLL